MPADWILHSSKAPKLLMPTFRASVRDHCNSIATWWGSICSPVRILPAIHDPDGLFYDCGSTNLTFHYGLSIRLLQPASAKRSPTPMVRRARLSKGVFLSFHKHRRPRRQKGFSLPGDAHQRTPGEQFGNHRTIGEGNVGSLIRPVLAETTPQTPNRLQRARRDRRWLRLNTLMAGQQRLLHTARFSLGPSLRLPPVNHAVRRRSRPAVCVYADRTRCHRKAF
jgi:hypothetical protein